MNPIWIAGAAGAADIPAQVITTIVTFLLVVFTLKWLAWGPVLELLDARKSAIENEFKQADDAKEKGEEYRREYEGKLANAEKEAQDILNRTSKEAEEMAERIRNEAKQEAERIIAKARESVQMEVDQARIELRREVVEMTLAATGRLLDATVDDEKHRNLVDGFVTELEKQKA